MVHDLINNQSLQEMIQGVFKRDYQILNITRLLGGAQKGTYKVTCSNDFTCVLYIWDPSLTYFDTQHTEEVFTSNSAELFEKNHALLVQNHISVPKLYYMDRSKGVLPFEYALVEYIDGSDLESLLNDQTTDCQAMLMDLKENLKRLHALKSQTVGDLKYTRDGTFSCEAYIKSALQDSLDYLITNYEPITKLKEKVLATSNRLHENVKSRRAYTMIHFELGPNHVMIDKNRKVYLIDIEGMKFFDLEYEYSFLELRFGKNYPALISLEVDSDRMNYYKFAHHIFALEGAHHLLCQNYYDLEDIKGMLTFNYRELVEKYLTA